MKKEKEKAMKKGKCKIKVKKIKPMKEMKCKDESEERKSNIYYENEEKNQRKK